MADRMPPVVQSICALCAALFGDHRAVINGTGGDGQPRYNVTLRDVVAGVAKNIDVVGVGKIPVFAVTMIRGTLACEVHASEILNPPPAPFTPFRADWVTGR